MPTKNVRADRDVDDCGVTNGFRAERAEAAVIEWRGTDKPDDTYETNVQDLLNDLMHLCDRDRIDFEEALRMAHSNYEQER